MFYRQLPAHSPIPNSVLPRLAVRALGRSRSDSHAKLRALLTERYAAHDCRLFASGAQALQVALQLASRRSSAPVLLPAYTCYEVATAAVGARVNVALYDVDATTLEPNWESVRAAGARGAAALVVAPLYGMPLDWGAAQAAARAMGAMLIADVAQAHGTLWQGRPAGSVGDLIVMSFGRGKGWTGAGGGALLLGGNHSYPPSFDFFPVEATGFATEATTAVKAGSQWLLGRRSLYGLPRAIPFLHLGETIYHEPTHPAHMTQTSASLVIATEQAANAEVLHRRRNARDYVRRLSEAKPGIRAILGARINDESGALRFPILVRGGWARIRESAGPRFGAAGPYPTTLREITALLPFLTNVDADFRDAQLLVRELITLPTHSQVTEIEKRELVESVIG